MLRRFLQNINHVNCQIYQAKGDADVLIVTTAVESARQRITVLVGDHTDLLVIDGMDVTSISNQNQLNSRRRVWNMKTVKEQQNVISSRHFGMGQHLPSLRNWQSCSVEEIGQHSSESKLKCSTCILSSTLHDMAAGEKSLYPSTVESLE